MNKELERYKEAMEMVQAALRAGCFNVLQKKIDFILNPPPEMEEVEVVSWAIIAPSGFVETTSGNESLQRDQVANENSPFYGYQVAKLTGTYKRPKVQPVERSVSVEVKWLEGERKGVIDLPIAFPLVLKGDADAVFELTGKTGTLTFTWTDPAE